LSGNDSRSSPLATFSGRVVRIEDGDTISVLDDANRNYKIRLQGIDAPEGGQAFGDRSRQNLADEVFGKQVSVEWSKRDQYGRIVGKVLVDGRDVCLEQIRAGLAWHYKYYQNEQSAEDRKMYADAEEEARTEKRGLWVDGDPTPPWEFRRSGNK
jgi:endonuclease YncB( thermonuclease family)